MYVLHYAPDNASMIIRLVLEGADLPYRTALVDRSTRQQDSAAYRALNPMGLIPTLQTQHGAMSETAAILLWLGDQHGLTPAPHTSERPVMLQWLTFTANTAHADLRQMFYPDRYVPASAKGAHHRLMAARMLDHFDHLNREAEAHPALFGIKGILAPYVCALMRWSVLYPRGQTGWFTLGDFPALHGIASALEAAPQSARVALAEGLGRHPFTAPAYPVPPEGSAI
ncbi:MAG: glutathione S-transferase N-terminal domain-containing protein [Pseudotabrizicola sp.]|uniref:glutathione S-transferase family protein n=1 Tax=Pseudotabrizicola sp. TaxID=2939647 RepID=UPI00271F4740|nr:glutathione S-transferase N-terminal domain-containing protein [Pseudotabrizicola sp.]MDO8881724.1 glutathione S-transferase N-terminal domain-containing protein [Pseudotabrizicola sp.]MDP2080403.1 glutathione S-transferase N-terminal domain-containing protein [Pseudotabrizicola sp.]MDZ7573753.1 glutathione S-transferase N-terminal domain-containing protein [Pseudotabrizicola sp.]